MRLLSEVRRMQKLAGLEPPQTSNVWKWKDPRAPKIRKSVQGISVGDQVEYQGRMYNVEAIGANLAHLALVDPNNLTPAEISSQQDGRVSVNPKFLKPVQ